MQAWGDYGAFHWFLLSEITAKITEPEKVVIVYKFRTQVRLRVHRIVILRILSIE
jgi:hypothetical protein